MASDLERARKKAEQAAREKRRIRQARFREKKKATRAATLAKGDRRTNIVRRTRAKALACALSTTPEATLFDVRRAKRFVAGVTNYHGIVDAIRARVEVLGMTLHDLDAMCGFHDGYCSHLLSTDRKHSRNIGVESLPKLLRALGLTLALVESAPRTAAAVAELEDIRSSKARKRAREMA
jgi:hypothetical protein